MARRDIKGVIFDVGGVLISQPQKAIRSYEKSLEVPQGSIGAVFVHGQPDNAFSRLERGELTLSQFVPEFDKECYHLNSSRGQDFPLGFSTSELFEHMAASSVPNHTMLSLVRTLRKNGYKTCALTNNWIDGKGNQWQFEVLGDHFDIVIQSCVVGIRKPSAEIYELACEKMQLHPSEVVFLDDIGANLKSARKLGMSTIKVTEVGQAVRELEQILDTKLSLNSKL